MPMSRRERLTATLRGEPVDRPPVCFYEINGFTEDPDDPSPFNIFADPSWQPLLELARERADAIPSGQVGYRVTPPDPLDELKSVDTWIDDKGSRHIHETIQAGSRTLTAHQRLDLDVHTWWTTEHLLKDIDDFKAWLELPMGRPPVAIDPEPVLRLERELGDAGIIMLNTADPLCMVAPRFHMEEYTIIALTEPELFRRALDRCAAWLLPHVEAICEALPGYLWRIYGPEYASPPYLPPRLFNEYVVPYVTELVGIIQRSGGHARVHSHGRLKDILPLIASTGCDGLDPVEPPPQGDMALSDVRRQVGEQMVLFGNLEIADIETMPTPQFREQVRRALAEGTAGAGRGFVLMPSAAPYGRVLPELTLRNYQAIIEELDAWG